MIPNTREISSFMHCKMCVTDYSRSEERKTMSMRDYARIEVGWTDIGLQVWCTRHNLNIMHVDFQGLKHPANLTCIVEVPTEVAES